MADWLKKEGGKNVGGVDIGFETIFKGHNKGLNFVIIPCYCIFYYTADQAAACLLGLRPEGSQVVFLRCRRVSGLAVFGAGLDFGERDSDFFTTAV